jgi:alpha-N-arabinofuranosidase
VVTAAAINAHNTFDQPAVVKPAASTGAVIESGNLKATLPPKSVLVLDLK